MSATPALEVPADEAATVAAPASAMPAHAEEVKETAETPAQTPETTSEQPPVAAQAPDLNASRAAERVRQSKLLPPALKERLALLVEASGSTALDAQATAPIEEALRAVEEALPDFLLARRSRADKPEHPGGDSFFSGDPRELYDSQAEQIAREQLVRSGLLRGQRVRVAD